LPVTVILPLPGIIALSMVSSSPPTSVHATRDDANLVLGLDLAVAILGTPIVRQGLGVDQHRLLLGKRQLLHRLADQRREPRSRLHAASRVAPDQKQQRLVVDRLPSIKAMLADRVRDRLRAISTFSSSV
jgi:hypothetical protein